VLISSLPPFPPLTISFLLSKTGAADVFWPFLNTFWSALVASFSSTFHVFFAGEGPVRESSTPPPFPTIIMSLEPLSSGLFVPIKTMCFRIRFPSDSLPPPTQLPYNISLKVTVFFSRYLDSSFFALLSFFLSLPLMKRRTALWFLCWQGFPRRLFDWMLSTPPPNSVFFFLSVQTGAWPDIFSRLPFFSVAGIWLALDPRPPPC